MNHDNDNDGDIRAVLTQIANTVRSEPPSVEQITQPATRANARRRGATSGPDAVRTHASAGVRAARLAAVGLVVAGVVAVVANRQSATRHLGQPQDTVPVESTVMHHSRIEITLTAQLVCDRQIDNTGKFTTLVIDSYSDPTGRRWATRATYPDGSTHDFIMFGSAIYPNRFYGRGKSLNARFGCIGPNNEEYVLSIDGSNGGPYFLNLKPELGPGERQNVQLFRDNSTRVDGVHTDDRGRPSELWELRINGKAGYGNTADHPLVQVEDWWVDPTDGTTVTQHRFTNTIDQLGTATVTATLTTDEDIPLQPSTFDATGYTSLPTSPPPTINTTNHPPLPSSLQTAP